MADKLTKEQRKRNMQACRSKGTGIERILGKALWSAGLRYRKNDNSVFGKPDFTFKGAKVAVFTDGEFWHGKDWEVRKNDHKSNVAFWTNKIERNIERDTEVTKHLLKDGWKVLRFWGNDVIQHTEDCVEKIRKAVKNE